MKLTKDSAIKQFVKEWCATNRPKFTRVSSGFIDRAEAHLKSWIVFELHRHPSVGKTIE